jgi:hypothetical protein
MGLSEKDEFRIAVHKIINGIFRRLFSLIKSENNEILTRENSHMKFQQNAWKYLRDTGEIQFVIIFKPGFIVDTENWSYL